MMAINLITQGIIAAASGTPTPPVTTMLLPAPKWANGSWWSFVDNDNGVFQSGANTIRVDQFSSPTSLAVFNTVLTETTPQALAAVVSIEGNGYVNTGAGNFLNSKSLLVPTESWVSVVTSSIPGGFVVGGVNAINYNGLNSTYVLFKSGGRDIYTSPDARAWTPVNGTVENTLRTTHNFTAVHIIHNGTTYVAVGSVGGATTTLRFATSTDLLNWTLRAEQVANISPAFARFFYFKGAWFFALDTGTGDSFTIYRSTDVYTWSQIYTSPDIAVLSTFHPIITKDKVTFFGTEDVYSTDGVSFTSGLPQINVNHAKRSFEVERTSTVDGALYNLSTSDGPEFMAMRPRSTTAGLAALFEVGTSTYDTRKAFPEAGSDFVGFIAGGQSSDMFSSSSAELLEGWYAHDINEVVPHHFEITVTSRVSTASKLGVNAIGRGETVRIPTPTSGKTQAYVTLNGDVFWFADGVLNQILGAITAIAEGSVISFTLDVDDNELEVRVNGSLVFTFFDMANNYSFVPFVQAETSALRLNVGQDALSLPSPLSEPWGTRSPEVTATFEQDSTPKASITLAQPAGDPGFEVLAVMCRGTVAPAPAGYSQHGVYIDQLTLDQKIVIFTKDTIDNSGDVTITNATPANRIAAFRLSVKNAFTIASVETADNFGDPTGLAPVLALSGNAKRICIGTNVFAAASGVESVSFENMHNLGAVSAPQNRIQVGITGTERDLRLLLGSAPNDASAEANIGYVVLSVR